jgi:hypothetical protein
VVSAFAKVGVAPRGTAVEEGARFVREEIDKWAKVVAGAKLKAAK